MKFSWNDMEKITEIVQYKLFTKISGEGTPILMLHSYWGSHRLFENLSQNLSKINKIIRVDFPGHGNSENPPPDFTFEQFADITDELLVRLNISEKIIIIGHSMGGYAAMAYATRFKDKVASLVLFHSPIRKADHQSIKLRNKEGQLLLKGKKALLLQFTIPSNFAPENLGRMTSEIALIRDLALEVTVEGALGAIYAINHRADSIPLLQRSVFPILIFIGLHDKVYKAEEQLEDAALLPNAKVVVLNHSGHLGFLEEEALVIDKISLFLKGLN